MKEIDIGLINTILLNYRLYLACKSFSGKSLGAGHCPLGMWLLLGCLCPRGWPHTHVIVGSTNWTQEPIFTTKKGWQCRDSGGVGGS